MPHPQRQSHKTQARLVTRPTTRGCSRQNKSHSPVIRYGLSLGRNVNQNQASIMVYHVQQADHDSIRVADRGLRLTLLYGICNLKDRKGMQLFGIMVDANSMN